MVQDVASFMSALMFKADSCLVFMQIRKNYECKISL